MKSSLSSPLPRLLRGSRVSSLAASTSLALSAALFACSSAEAPPGASAGAAGQSDSAGAAAVSGAGANGANPAAAGAPNGGAGVDASGGTANGGDAATAGGGTMAGGSGPASGGAGGGSSGAGSGGVGGVGGGSAAGGHTSAAGGNGGAATIPLPTTWIPPNDYQATKNVPHGKVQTVSYDSPILKITKRASVYTPPAYDTAQKYPVLYALHGIGGDETEWLRYNTRVNEILDNLLAAKKIVPMVVVFPNGRALNPDKVPSDLYSTANVQAFHDFWNKDMRDNLIPFIQKTFSVYTDKPHRAVLGYSMGGGQALEMSFGSPDYFEYVGALAPAYRPDLGSQNAATVNGEFRELFLSAGTNDTVVGYTPILDFHNALTSKGITHVWVSVQNGAHDGTTWCPGMYNFTQIIFK